MGDYQSDKDFFSSRTAVHWTGQNCKEWVAGFRRNGYGHLILHDGKKKGKSALSMKKEFDDEIVLLSQPRREKKVETDPEDETEEEARQRRKLATIMAFQGHAPHAPFYRADGVTPEDDKEQATRRAAWKYIVYTFKPPYDLIYQAFTEGDVMEFVFHIIEVAGKVPKAQQRIQEGLFMMMFIRKGEPVASFRLRVTTAANDLENMGKVLTEETKFDVFKKGISYFATFQPGDDPTPQLQRTPYYYVVDKSDDEERLLGFVKSESALYNDLMVKEKENKMLARGKVVRQDGESHLAEGKGGRGKGSRGDLHPTSERNKGICFHFQSGDCFYGESCRFAHTPMPDLFDCGRCDSRHKGLCKIQVKKLGKKNLSHRIVS
jgi:hypothetical protein